MSDHTSTIAHTEFTAATIALIMAYNTNMQGGPALLLTDHKNIVDMISRWSCTPASPVYVPGHC